MPDYKHIIKVKREEEKRFYRILRDLEIERESIIKESSSEWNGTMRKFGIRTKQLIKKELIEKTWIQRDDSNIVKKRMIRLPEDVDVKEKKGKDISFFHFKKRNII